MPCLWRLVPRRGQPCLVDARADGGGLPRHLWAAGAHGSRRAFSAGLPRAECSASPGCLLARRGGTLASADPAAALRPGARTATAARGASLDPANRQSWTASSRRGGERMRELWASGERQRPQPARTGWQKARARWLALLEDPAYRAEFKRKISAARAGRVEVPCATCGRPLAVARHPATAERRFCGTACLREFQRQRGREHGREMAARSRQLTKSCDACGEPFVGTGRQRYCSLRCKVLAKNHRVSYTCPGCSAPFTGRSRQRYCSRHCAARAARAAQANPPPDARASPDGR